MNNNGKKMFYRHGLGMMICCMLPILILALLPLLGIKAAWLSSLASLICPISMIFMMFGMRHSQGKNCCGEKEDQNVDIQENAK
jgi:Na+-driven multidrug efflux pump